MFSEAVKYTRKLADVSPLKDMIGTLYRQLMSGAWADIVALARSERDEPWARGQGRDADLRLDQEVPEYDMA